MSRKFHVGAIALASLVVAGTASAAPIQLTSSVANGTLNQGVHTGVFDGKPLLPNKFVINSAWFVFDFADDVDSIVTGAPLQTGEIAGGYSQVGSTVYDGSNYRTRYERNSTVYREVQRTGQAEGVTVSIDGATVGSGATSQTDSSSTTGGFNGQYYTTSSGYNGYTYTYGCGTYGNRTCRGYQPGSWSDYYTNQYNSTTTSTRDWTGIFSVTGDLIGTPLLDQFLLTRELQFGLSVTGDLNLTGGSLFLDFTEVIPDTNGTPVPEPSALLLAMGALAGAGVGVWRRRRR